MSRGRWRRPSRSCRPIAAAALAVLLGIPAASSLAARPAWTVVVDGRDRTAAAEAMEVEDVVLIDLAGLAPYLGLQVALGSDSATVIDRQGVRWTGSPGSSLLRAGLESRTLSWVRQTPTSWHVPAEVVAVLAHRALALDRGRRWLELGGWEAGAVEPGSPPLHSRGSSSDAWEAFTLSKTAEEIAAGERFEAARVRPGAPPEAPLLPPVRQGLRTTLGLGFRQGGEWGAQFAASGLWSDWSVQLSGVAALGPAGSELQGQLFVEDPDRVWSFESGSLYSETVGYAEGLRVAWAREHHRPALAIYLPGSLTTYHEPLVAFRDDLSLGKGLRLGGEVTSEGRWSLTGRLRRGRFASSVFARGEDEAASTGGGSLFLDFGPVGLSGTYQLSDTPGGRIDSHNLQLTLPRIGRLTPTVEGFGSRSAFHRSHAQGATFSLPLGDLAVRLRYLMRTNEFRTLGSGPVSQESRELVALLGYAGSRRLRLDLQVTSRWQERGESSQRADLQASFSLAAGTHLQLLGSFSPLDEAPQSYRIRLAQDLPRGLRLIAEVGDVLGFSTGRSLLDPGQESGSFRLLVQHTWDVSTPAGGGSVGGRVLAPGGTPAADVPVRLGPYRVFTDAAGGYRFRKVPPGDYELSLEEPGLPAHLQAESGPKLIRVERGPSQDHVLFVAPLGLIAGRVYVDRDGDGRLDEGERLGGIVLLLGGEATTSGGDGTFAFHNLAAGSYRLEVVAAHLPANLQVASPSRFDIGLPAGGSLDTLDVRLLPRQRPIRFQEL